jgi:nitrogen PTS system EIIA component
MDLRIKDVAELLSVSESTIRRWLIEGKIPAYRLNHQYRFSRAEVENWMLKCKFKPATSSSKEEETPCPRGGMQHFSLYRAIHRGGVYGDILGETKEEIVRAATPSIAEKLNLDPEVVAELLMDRERLMATALNNGIAVPHSRECLQRIPFDLITVVFPQAPVHYGALDGKPVHTLFFLFASDDKIHLHLLAKLAHLSSHEQALQLLKKRPPKNALLEFVRNWEDSLHIP